MFGWVLSCFLFIWKRFFGQLLLFMCMHGNFEIFGREHLDGSLVGAELDLELRNFWSMVPFLLKCSTHIP